MGSEMCIRDRINAIKAGLKKLRDTGVDHEGYIAEVVAKIKAGMTKKAADGLLKEIGEKIAEAGAG